MKPRRDRHFKLADDGFVQITWRERHQDYFCAFVLGGTMWNGISGHSARAALKDAVRVYRHWKELKAMRLAARIKTRSEGQSQ